MSRYMLISSREPFTSEATNEFYDLAGELRRQGHEVTLFLIENGVLAARATARCQALLQVAAAGVNVLADDFALRQRAISHDALLAGVEPAGLERLLDGLTQRTKTIWH